MASTFRRGVAWLAWTGSSLGLAGLVGLRVRGKTVRWSPAAIAFTPAFVPAGVALGLLAGARRRRLVGLLFGGSAAAVIPLIAPRARAVAQPGVGSDAVRLRIMSANVYKGRADAQALVALVRQHRPDVLAIQEQNPRFIAELRDAGLFELLPNRVVADGGRLADGSLISRFPLTRIAPHLPSEYVAAQIGLPGGRTVPIICAHPLPPSSPRYEDPWFRSLEILPTPTDWMDGGIVAGDFNATLDHPQFQAVLASGWRDAGSQLGHGLKPTWGGHGVLRLTIDHVLAPPGAAIVDYCVDRLPGSDHRAITATLDLPLRD